MALIHKDVCGECSKMTCGQCAGLEDNKCGMKVSKTMYRRIEKRAIKSTKSTGFQIRNLGTGTHRDSTILDVEECKVHLPIIRE